MSKMFDPLMFRKMVLLLISEDLKILKKSLISELIFSSLLSFQNFIFWKFQADVKFEFHHTFEKVVK